MTQLSLRLTVSGTDYYLSDEAFLRNDGQFHYGYLLQPPRIKLAQVKGGYLDFEIGQMLIENRPFDANHPFGGSRYPSMLTNVGTAYTFALRYGLQNYDWITGTLVLEKVDREALTFSVNATEYAVDVSGTVTDYSGNVITAPFVYGACTHFTPMIRIADGPSYPRWYNPTGLTSGVTIFEDGVSRTINAITATYIEVSDYSADQGEVSISSSTTKTLEDFFDYVAVELSLDVSSADTTKATSASSYDVKIQVNAAAPLLELASDLAASYNHQFSIQQDSSGDSTLYLVDRAYSSGSLTEYKDFELMESSYNLGFPLGGVSTSWTITEPEGGRLVRKSTSARSANKPKGRELSAGSYADSYADVTRIQGRLDAIRDIEKKPTAKVVIPEISADLQIGDRLQFRRLQDFLECTLTVRAIDYDFDTKTTTVEGDSLLTEFILDF